MDNDLMCEPMDACKEMPKYKCYKEVWALKIKDIIYDEQGKNCESAGAMIQPEDSSYSIFPIDSEYISKHNPFVGGYYVVYKGGYKSFSPAKEFEDGYTLIQ